MSRYLWESGNPVTRLDPLGTEDADTVVGAGPGGVDMTDTAPSQPPVAEPPAPAEPAPDRRCRMRIRCNFLTHCGAVVQDEAGTYYAIDGTGSGLSGGATANYDENRVAYNGIAVEELPEGWSRPGNWVSDWMDVSCDCIDRAREKAFDERQIQNGNRYDYLLRNSNHSLKCSLGDCDPELKLNWSLNPIGWGKNDRSDCDTNRRCRK